MKIVSPRELSATEVEHVGGAAFPPGMYGYKQPGSPPPPPPPPYPKYPG